MKKLSFYLLAFLFVFFACNDEKDESAAQQLQGEWKVTSFTSNGGANSLAASPDSELNFGAYNGAEGDFEFVFVDKSNTISRSKGKYALNEAQTEIELIYNPTRKQKYALTVNQNKLTMEADVPTGGGLPGTNRQAITAEKQ